MERLKYLDNLKLIAIITVVAWHLMSLGLHYINEPWSLIFSSCSSYAFMFVSGMLAYSKVVFTKADFISFFLKAARRLLIPFIVIGGLYGYLTVRNPLAVYNGAIQHYWFLPVLFFLMNFSYLVLWLSRASIKYHLLIVSFLFFGAWFVFSLVYLKYGNVTPFYLNMCKIYPFFIFGVFAGKWEGVKTFLENPFVVSSALVFSVVVYMFDFKSPIPLSPFFGIIIWWAIAKWSANHIPVHFSKLGTYTLEIYVFHYFLMPNLPTLGLYLARESTTSLLPKVIDNGNFLLSGLIVIGLSFMMIYGCVIFAEVIKFNKFIRGFFLGQW